MLVMAAHASASESVKCIWKELSSTHSTSCLGSVAQPDRLISMLPEAMLPAVGASSPQAVSIAAVISVVEVLPLVPVMPIHGAGSPVRAVSTRRRHANSTSLITGMPRRCASRIKGVRGLNTGEAMTASMPRQSMSSKACRSASGLRSSTVTTRAPRRRNTCANDAPETPRPATSTVISAQSIGISFRCEDEPVGMNQMNNGPDRATQSP